MNQENSKDFSYNSNDIIEDVMKIAIPQQSRRLIDMYNAAQDYYRLLNYGEGITPEYKKKLKDELDALRARFGTDGGDIAYYAFLDMEKITKECEQDLRRRT